MLWNPLFQLQRYKSSISLFIKGNVHPKTKCLKWATHLPISMVPEKVCYCTAVRITECLKVQTHFDGGLLNVIKRWKITSCVWPIHRLMEIQTQLFLLKHFCIILWRRPNKQIKKQQQIRRNLLYTCCALNYLILFSSGRGVAGWTAVLGSRSCTLVQTESSSD